MKDDSHNDFIVNYKMEFSPINWYLLKVYLYMALGLSITGIVMFLISSSHAFLDTFLVKSFIFPVFFLPLILIYYISYKIYALSALKAHILFLLYALSMGLYLSPLIILYTETSITNVFFITAFVFGITSVYGYYTKVDLSTLRTFVVMGLIGLICAGFVNLLTQSSLFDFYVSMFGVLLFTVLTAIDIQQIKNIYFSTDAIEINENKAIIGALALYLDYLNLSLSFLNLFGCRKNK